MRRLLLLAGVLVFVDTMLYAALTPLLPRFAHEFGLSKSSAGTLVAAYAAGALIGGLFVGVVESLSGLYLGESLGQIDIFVMFILVLLFRPSGLFGERT